MVVIAASYLTMRSETRPGDPDPVAIVKPPELRVVLWHAAPYAVYGMAYFVMILVSPMIVGFAYGHTLGVDQYVYPSTFEGSADLALLELVVLLGLVYASIERFGRRLRPLLEAPDPRLLAAGPHHPPSGVAQRRFGADRGVGGRGLASPEGSVGRAPVGSHRLGPDSRRTLRPGGGVVRLCGRADRHALQPVPVLPRQAAGRR